MISEIILDIFHRESKEYNMPKEQETWEEKLKSIFDVEMLSVDIKQFISNLLSTQKEELKRKVEGMNKVTSWIENCCPRIDEKAIAYNLALSDVIGLLN